MNVVIVEDSLEDILNLRALIDGMSGLHIVGVAHNLAQARLTIQEQRPDLVFLDIELGMENSFDLIHELPESSHFIFTTVHTGYGAAAFDVNALDYIVKPITEERLLRALAKIRPGSNPGSTRVLVYRGGGERCSLALDTIAAIIADRDNSIVICGNKHYRDHRRFREWAELLQKNRFTQLDRSTLIRMDQVHSWQPYGAGLLLNFRHSIATLEIGRAASKRFEELQERALPPLDE
jgi:two-component system LytT family response regulator